MVAIDPEQFRDCSLGLMAAANIGYFRWPLPWNDVELTPGQYNWTYIDRLVGDVAKHHMRFLPVLIGVPQWLSTAPAQGAQGGLYPPKDPRQFGQFAALCVQRYGPGGSFWQSHPSLPYYPIRAWQVWNEPEFAYQWEPQPNMRAFARLLRVAYAAIKRADRRATVVAGGMAFVNDSAEIYYMSRLYRYGARGSFDAFALHDYSLTVAQAIHRLWLARQLMNRFRDRHASLWVTEIAWAGGGRNSFITNYKKQAANVSAFFKLVQKDRAGLRLGEVFWYDWTDQPPPPGSPGASHPRFWIYNLGVFTADLHPKPAFAAISAWARRLDR